MDFNLKSRITATAQKSESTEFRVTATNAHRPLTETFVGQIERAQTESEWPIVVDTGSCAVFHGLEAPNSIECRDSISFADAADDLVNVLTGHVLKALVRQALRPVSHFRRGALNGCHMARPGADQGVPEDSWVLFHVDH